LATASTDHRGVLRTLDLPAEPRGTILRRYCAKLNGFRGRVTTA
jgi:hypothetical protein